MNVLLLSLGVGIFFVLVAVLPLHVRVCYLRSGKDDTASVGVSTLFGILKYRYEIPVMDLRPTVVPHLRYEVIPKLFGKKNKTKTKEVKPININSRVIKKLIFGGHKLLRQAEVFQRQFYKGITCRKLRCVMNVGLKDPALTGMAIGGAWSAIGQVLGKLNNSISLKIDKPEIAVLPSFREQRFDLDIDCIFRVRAGHIIVAGFRVLKMVKTAIKGARTSESSN